MTMSVFVVESLTFLYVLHLHCGTVFQDVLLKPQNEFKSAEPKVNLFKSK